MQFFHHYTVQSELECSLKTTQSEHQFRMRPRWTNSGSQTVELGESQICWTLPPEFANARLLSSDAAMGSHCELFEQATLPGRVTSRSSLLFRLAPDRFFLAGLLTARKLLIQWALTRQKLTLSFFGDGKRLAPGESFEGDECVFLTEKSAYETQTGYGELLAAENPRKRNGKVWRGWGSWDYFADEFTEKQLLENFAEVRKLYPQSNLLQVDDGYSLWGDWLDVKESVFPRGMKPFVDEVKRQNAAAGLWMAPFWADTSSKLFQEHRDWFLKDADGNPIQSHMVVHHLALLDYSQDEVCAWWKNVIRTARREWGYEYFKFDFLSTGVIPCTSKYPMPPLERFHRCFDIIEEVMGNDTFVLGCSAYFPPCFGRVDALRTGSDISPNFASVKTSVWGNSEALHFNNRVVRDDGDYLVLREKADEDPQNPPAHAVKLGTLSDDEAQSWANFVTLFNGTVLSSDNLPSLREKRRGLVQKILSSQICDEAFALDLFAGDNTLPPGVFLARRGNRNELLTFNWSNEEKSFRITDKNENTVWAGTLAPHASHCLLLPAGAETFAELASSLNAGEAELPRIFPDVRTKPFTPTGILVPIPLGFAAQCPLRENRTAGTGMLNGKFTGILQKSNLGGVKFDFSVSSERVVAQESSAKNGFEIPVGQNVNALYFLQGAYLPVKGQFTVLHFHYADGTEAEEPLQVGDHLGNTDFRYALPWHGTHGTLAWADNINFATLYVSKWQNPHPDKMLKCVTSDALQLPGTLFLVALTAEKD